jgi:hypothetical protein
MSRFLRACARIAALWVIARAHAQPPPQPQTLPVARVPDALGVNIHFVDPRRDEMEMLAAAGFSFVRMDVSWAATERKRGEFDFAPWARLLEACDKQKIRALFIFDYSNPLYDENLSPHSDEGVAAFARWATALVKEFAGRGIIWEIYNEPNISFWRPAPDVNAYIKLALATAKSIKAAAPGELLVGPALSGTDGAWLEPCYKAGLLEYWDAVTVHPYGNEPPETRIPHYEMAKALIARYAPEGKTIPLLSGEWGYSSANLSPQKQGEFLARQWLVNLSQGIPLSIWYDWRDDGTDPKNNEHRFGTVEHEYLEGQNPVFKPKPAYDAARTLTTQLRGFRFRERVRLERDTDFLLLFEKEKELRAVAWTTENTPHAATLPSLSAGRYRVTDFNGDNLPELATGPEGLRLALSNAPKYVVRK